MATVGGFGGALKRLREAHGLSRRELARRAGLNATYVSMLERGERSPSDETLAKLAAGLGLSDHEEPELYGAAGRLPPPVATEKMVWLTPLGRGDEAAVVHSTTSFEHAIISSLAEFLEELAKAGYSGYMPHAQIPAMLWRVIEAVGGAIQATDASQKHVKGVLGGIKELSRSPDEMEWLLDLLQVRATRLRMRREGLNAKPSTTTETQGKPQR